MRFRSLQARAVKMLSKALSKTDTPSATLYGALKGASTPPSAVIPPAFRTLPVEITPPRGGDDGPRGWGATDDVGAPRSRTHAGLRQRRFSTIVSVAFLWMEYCRAMRNAVVGGEEACAESSRCILP